MAQRDHFSQLFSHTAASIAQSYLVTEFVLLIPLQPLNRLAALRSITSFCRLFIRGRARSL